MKKKLISILERIVNILTGKERKTRRLDIQKKFGEDIVNRRDDEGLSQKQLQHASGMAQSTLSQIELGNSNFTLDSLMQLAVVFDTSIVGVLRDPVFHENLRR